MQKAFDRDKMFELSAWLKKQMVKEHLWNAEAGRLLNLNSLYISMMVNPRSMHGCSKGAWARVEEVKNQGINIADFKIPEGEVILKAPEPKRERPVILPPAEKAESFVNKEKIEKELKSEAKAKVKEFNKGKGKKANLSLNAADLKVVNAREMEVKQIIKNAEQEAEEHSPDAVLEVQDSIKKEMRQLLLIDSKIDRVFDSLKERNRFFLAKIEELDSEMSKLKAELKQLQGSEGNEKAPAGIVVFQRNIYKS
jgi:hypothetical protein